MIKELVTTEKEYLSQLSVLSTVYCEPVLRVVPTQDPIHQEFRRIGSDIKVISNVSSVLLNNLLKRLDNWYKERQKIGDVVLKLVFAHHMFVLII